jgi:Protein of unknown function (DUF3309)
MSLGTILLIILVLLVIGALPTWGYSSAWGPAPAGLLGVVLIVVLILTAAMIWLLTIASQAGRRLVQGNGTFAPPSV